MKILTKLKNMLLIGFLSEKIDDTKNRQIANIVTNGKKYPSMNISPYGLNTNPPVNKSHVINFNISSQELNNCSMAFLQKYRAKNLKGGEVLIKNILADNSIYLQEDKKITIKAGNDIVINNNDCTITIKNNEIILQNSNAELKLTNNMLISNVAIQAPDFQGSSGTATFSQGINLSDKPLTAKGVDLTNHIHAVSGDNTLKPKENPTND